MTQGLNESQFYMWRTLFAIAHADNIVTPEERKFMNEVLDDESIPFSPEQKETLRADIQAPQDIGEMFRKISDAKDQADFFRFAQKMVWIDGTYGKEEQEIMLQLKSEHIKGVNVDDLIGNVTMEFDDGTAPPGGGGEDRSVKKIIHSFRDEFLKTRFGDAASS